MSAPVRKIIIAIDGHSSCGKSTFAKAIAAKLDYIYIDSGAMYRAVTLACMENSLIRDGHLDEKRLPEILMNIEICFQKKPSPQITETWLNGVNVEERIRSVDVASNVSLVSKSRIVRKKLVSMQREMGRDKGIVMDGRDIGTVVFPHADIKIFMTADPEIRAGRRYRELRDKGMDVDFNDILENISERDRLDENRSESPLKKAPDALLLDNSYMTPEQQLEWFSNILLKTDLMKCRK